MNPIRDLYNSFNTDKGGFSARKLAAFSAIMAGIIISVKHSNTDNAFMLACANYTFGAVCLGLVTAAQLIQFKTGNKPEEPKVA